MKRNIKWSDILIWLVCPLAVVALIAFLASCAPTEKVVYEHIHHYQQADSMATEATHDTHVSNTTALMDSIARHVFNEYRASWFSHEDEKEVTTETITTTVDSLGRQIRTEQRTTERNLSRMQQQTEQRLTQEFEQRLQTAIEHHDSLWQQRLTQVQAHWEQQLDRENTTATKTEHQPWYTRWWQTLKGYLLCAAVVLLLIATRRIWWPLCIGLFRK